MFHLVFPLHDVTFSVDFLYPAIHWQMYDPYKLIQFACSSQSLVAPRSLHSLISYKNQYMSVKWKLSIMKAHYRL